MSDTSTGSRARGRLDEVALVELDLVEFNDGINPWAPVRTVESGFRPSLRRHRKLVERWGFTELGAVADLGCGYGKWSMFLAEVNDRVYGVERNAEGVELCRKLAAHLELDNAEFEAADVRDVPRPAGSFDGVWCNNVVQFVDRGKLLDECARLLKPGGALFLGVANSTGRVLEKLFDGFAKGGLENPTTRWALTSLRQGPLFDGRPNYTTIETIGETLHRHGLELSEGYEVATRPEVDVAEASSRAVVSPFEEELRDLPAFAARLEADERLASEFAAQRELAKAFPRHIEVRATKPL